MLAVISDTGIIVLVAAFVLLFGASQLPKMARHLAEAGKEFRKAHAELGAGPATVSHQASAPVDSSADLHS
ncbi:MAG: twin-arginine translocase TatA/TatE family subunit [Acidimicrobiaceae bacterium]|nr:twin-arginine translocase TatA/TatE family subunit [Acidimicrobiaceae bacterium]